MGKKSKAEPPEFEVEEIREFRFNRGAREFYVKWKGFGDDQCSWEPEANMENATAALEAFGKKHELDLTPAKSSPSTKRGSQKLPAATGQGASQARRASLKDDDGSLEGNGSAKRGAKRLLVKQTDSTPEHDTSKRTRNEANNSGSKIWHGSSSRGAPPEKESAGTESGSGKRPARISFTSNKTSNAASASNTKNAATSLSDKKLSGNRTPATNTSSTRGNQQSSHSGGNIRNSRSSMQQPAKTGRGAQQHVSPAPRRTLRAPDSKVMKSEDLKQYSHVNVHALQGTVEHSEVVSDSTNNLLMQIDFKLNEKNGKVLRFTLTFDEIKMLNETVQDLAPLASTLSQSNAGEFESVGAAKMHDASLPVAMEGDDELIGGSGEVELGRRSSSRRHSPSSAAARSASSKRKEEQTPEIDLDKNDGILGHEFEPTDDERSKRGESEQSKPQSQDDDQRESDGKEVGHLNGNFDADGDDQNTTSRERNADRSSEADMLNGHGANVNGGDKAVGTGKRAEFSETDKQQNSGNFLGGRGGDEMLDDDLLRGIGETEAQ